MLLSSSIMLTAMVFCIMATIESFFKNGVRPFKKIGEEDGEPVRAKLDAESLIRACIVSVTVGLVNFLTPKVGGAIWLAPIFLIVMLAISGYLMYLWYKEGSSLKELVAFTVLSLLVYWTTMSTAAAATGITSNGFLTSLFVLIPKLVLVASIGFYLANMCFFERELAEEREDEDKAKLMKVLGWVIAVITAVICILMTIFGLNWGALKSSPDPQNLSAINQPNTTWYRFYNLDLSRDGDPLNDYNFGYNLADFEEGELEASDCDSDLRARTDDPKYSAAIIAWLDANLGTRFLGTFYDECKGEWASTMNNAAEAWMEDRESYQQTLDAFFAFLDTADSVELKSGKGIEDQMYMNPHTVSGVPDIIVMKTDHEEGLFLVYTFKIKENTFEVKYRIECGYQPTNVEEVMNITPQENPNNPGTTPSNPTPSNPTPTPTPTTPTNPKDPTKGTQGEVVGPNDNPGPGPDTNNGVGSQYSSEQTDDGSIFVPTYDEYKDIVENLEEINEDQKEGGDSNTPTVTPSAGTNVDNNGDKGTGNGSIDTPTQVTKPATTNDGESVTSDGAGEAWGGPPDA